MPSAEQVLHYAAEAVKIVGGLASFYAVVKLRKIEKRYLFKATIGELVSKLDDALSKLNASLSKPGNHPTEVMEALNYLFVDVTNLKRKCRGDSLRACKEVLAILATTRPRRTLWRAPVTPAKLEKALLLDLYGKGRGLIRSLENDMRDQGWSRE